MTKRDQLISYLFSHIGYCTGVITGLELRLREKECRADELCLFTQIHDKIRIETHKLLAWHTEILDEEQPPLKYPAGFSHAVDVSAGGGSAGGNAYYGSSGHAKTVEVRNFKEKENGNTPNCGGGRGRIKDCD